ncbi:hypothetical protein [Longispora fulva]|uniref:Parallel beta helix pectate lyase-like protein n=2 Tax=Longispora fulva TaxID=619741 RepID=A0A8J7KVY5_9ACTN|nr:hypothetical protein [Longispora fulva]MBG6135887.1 hypothetical protein [Longispora fulva]
MRTHHLSKAVWGLAALVAGLAVQAVPAATAATAVTLYASTTGSGTACTQAAPCALAGAQSAVRAKLAADPGADVTVLLADGTYRLADTWKFGAADSGSAGHPVSWRAAAGATPVISGATRVTGWTQDGTTGAWKAAVAAGSETRQLYVDGKLAPISGADRSALGWNGTWTGSSTGYDISADSTAMAWFGARTAAEVAGVEFDYPGGNGPWTESRCRVASFAGSIVTMSQPCWTNVTNRASFSQASGGLPSMGVSTKPTRVTNARNLLSAGEWYLDRAANTLYYQPNPGEQVASLDIELPRLEKLVQGAGTLANPLHDLTFQGLQFSYATWNDPSRPYGFADVQSNLRMTGGRDQGMCTFASPAGTCPWGSLTQPMGNVAFTATTNLSLTGNRFTNLGGAGLSVMYGAKNTLIQGNEFTDIASTALLLGCTYDPTPLNAPEAQGIKDHCTPDPAAVSGDTIGTNEILTGTTVSNNVIHHIGTEYSSACGITLLFSRGTKISNNLLYDLPYTAITAGVIQGHVDNAAHPQNSTNINENNEISGNIIHDYLSVRSDGGAIYVEGHQAGYRYQADGTTIDPAATLANGLQVKGNVAFDGRNTNFTYYDDAGSEWINWAGNAAFNAGQYSQGGCEATGHFWITGNYFSSSVENYHCASAVDSHASGNTTIPATPKPGDIPNSLLTAAGLTSAYLNLGGTPDVEYISPTTNATQVLIAGQGFTSTTPVYVKNVPVTGTQFLSGGFLVVPIPAGTVAADIRVGDAGPATKGRVDDTDSRIAYTSFATNGNRGFGDYNNDIHYATANGATASLTFSGTGVEVYGEQYTDQGTLGVSIDGGTQVVVNTVPTDGQRHANVAVFREANLLPGTHTIVVTKLSGQYAVLDGFAVLDTAVRIDDTAAGITYSGFALQGGRPYGDYNGDIHFATANGSTASLTFTGTGIQVHGEQYTDQGTLGVSIDGGTQVVVDTVPADGQRHANVAVFGRTGLSQGTHTIIVTKLSGQYAVLDGFTTLG